MGTVSIMKSIISSWVLDVSSRRLLLPGLPATCNCSVLFAIGYDLFKVVSSAYVPIVTEFCWDVKLFEYKEKSQGGGTQL